MKKVFLALILAFFAFALVHAKDVNVILNDGSVIKGNLLGKTTEEVYIEDTNGQSITIKMGDIKSAFDAESGDQIDLTSSSSTASVVTDAPVIADTTTTVIAAEPDVVVIPNTYVYYYTYDGYDCFYYGGFWWRPWHGYWYRSTIYNNGWVVINPGYVPYNVTHLPGRWREGVVNGPRVGYGDVRTHWQEWDRTHYWGSHGWNRNSYVRPGPNNRVENSRENNKVAPRENNPAHESGHNSGHNSGHVKQKDH